jgi:phenylacetic acid degradation operon negative regulatory protein
MPAGMEGNGAVLGPGLGRAAQPPGSLSGRQDRGPKTARGLLFTVLGEFVLPSGGMAWTSAIIAVLGRMGVEEKATRQALMRTAGDGWLSSERTGRRTCWRLTARGEQLLTEGTERIYSFTAARHAWDGAWLLVLARAPESDRPARHRLRTRLTWAGFGSPAPGVWLSPDTSRLAEAERVLASAGLLADSQIFRAEHAGAGQLSDLAREAWDLDQIEQHYEEFIADFATSAGAGELPRLIELVHRWRRFPWIDPVLPPELLPDPWRGSVAAQLFAERHAELAPGATAEWQRIMKASL